MLATRLRWDLVRQVVKDDFSKSPSVPASRPTTAPFRRANSTKDFVRAPSFGKTRMLRSGSGKSAGTAPVGWSSTGRLKNVFFQFTGGEMEMNQTMFLKFAKDCELFDENCDTNDVGIIYAKIRSLGSRKISYQQFLDGIWHCAQKRGEHMESLERIILESGGLKVTGTIPQANRLHDDRIETMSASGMSQASTVDQSAEEIASMSESRPSTSSSASRHWQTLRRPMTAKNLLRTSSTKDVFSRTESNRDMLSRTSSVKELKAPRHSVRSLMRAGGSFKDVNSTMLIASKELEKVFFTFSNYSSQMDRPSFVKFSEECCVVNSMCNVHDVKNIFADVKTSPSSKAITYAQFLDALKLCAARRQTTFEHIEKIVNRWAPSVTALPGNTEHRSLYQNGETTLRHVEAPHVHTDPVQNWDFATRGVKLDYVPLAPKSVFQRLMKHLDEKQEGPLAWDQAPCDPPPEPEHVDVFTNSMSAF